MDDFKQYLQAQKLQSRTIDEHLNNIRRFDSWLTEDNRLGITEIRYSDLLAYIQQERAKKLEPATINLRLNSVSKYFEYLKSTGEVLKNPAKTIRVKDELQKVIKNPLGIKELESLYQQYSCTKKVSHRQKQADQLHIRDTVIVGLLVFQGVHSGVLQKMETNHIDLNAGTVYIPSTSQGISRQLELSQKQILMLHQYISEIRQLLKPQGAELIPGSIRNIITKLVQELQGINPVINNALHIRASVILCWLKLYSKREVQYRAGHKYISSTEKYAEQQTDDLLDALSKHHPFG